MGSSDVKQLRRDDPSPDALSSLSDAASARIDGARSLERYHKAVIAQVAADLDALTGGAAGS